MSAANGLLLLISVVLLALSLRNLLGAASRFGVVSGWVVMVAFAGLAAYGFWMARDLRASGAPAGAVAAAQKAMVLFLAGLLFSAYAVGVQRRKLRKPATPPRPPLSSGE